MVTLIDPILTMKQPAEGIELQPLREPESMVHDPDGADGREA